MSPPTRRRCGALRDELGLTGTWFGCAILTRL